MSTTVSIGFASYLLGKDLELSGVSEVKSFLAKPPKTFIAYIAVSLAWGLLGLLLQPWTLPQTANSSSGLTYSYDLWYLLASSILLVAFLSLPVLNLYRQSLTLADATARRSLKIISLSWTGFGLTTLFQVAVPYTQALAGIVEGMLFVLIAFALREPTVLSRIISSHSGGRTVLVPHLNSKLISPITHSIKNSFSSGLGLDHQSTEKCRILLEFDPAAPYEDVVGKFVEEYRSYDQPVAVFTSISSPVRRRLFNEPDFSLFSFSSKTSTPSRRSANEVLLPERESSLMLDAVDKLLQANRGRTIALVFDVFGELALLQGFEKAYSILSSVLEMADSENATTLVLLNHTAHDERVLSGVRGLFVSRILCDMNGTRLVRFQRSDRSRVFYSSEFDSTRQPQHGVGIN